MKIERKELLIELMQMKDLDELRLNHSAVSDRIKEVKESINHQLLWKGINDSYN